ncbi:MAG TPA: response regulator [Longimicrobiales bacterium]
MAEATDEHAGSGGAMRPPKPALALVADLKFAARVRGAAAAVGARVRTVHSADTLLEAARAETPGMILLDLDLRGADVPALVRALKADPALAGVPVIAFGAHVRRDALAAAREAGADRVLARSAFVRVLPELMRGTTAAGPEA